MQAKLLVKLFKFKYQGLLHTSVLHLAYSFGVTTKRVCQVKKVLRPAVSFALASCLEGL